MPLALDNRPSVRAYWDPVRQDAASSAPPIASVTASPSHEFLETAFVSEGPTRESSVSITHWRYKYCTPNFVGYAHSVA